MQFTIKLIVPKGYRGQEREGLFLLPRKFVELFKGFGETPQICGEDLSALWGERNLFHPNYRCVKILTSSVDEAKTKFEQLKEEVKNAIDWLREHETEPEYELQTEVEI